jgi:uncharacterized membrane protein YbaN (DUF454 family)
MTSKYFSVLPNVSASRPMSSLLDRRGVRIALAVLGWVSLALGVVTLFVPLFPTTIFLLLAVWALSQSSSPGYHWLRAHPKLGPTMREWDEHGVIAPRAKVLAIASLASSVSLFGYFNGGNWALPAIFGVVMLVVAVYIATRPSNRPDQAPL